MIKNTQIGFDLVLILFEQEKLSRRHEIAVWSWGFGGLVKHLERAKNPHWSWGSYKMVQNKLKLEVWILLTRFIVWTILKFSIFV